MVTAGVAATAGVGIVEKGEGSERERTWEKERERLHRQHC